MEVLWTEDDVGNGDEEENESVEIGLVDFKLGVVLEEDCDESGGETQIWGGDGKEEQLSAAGHWILFEINRLMHEDLSVKQSWRHGWTEKSRKQNGAKVEQTKICEYGEQLELKRTSKWLMVAAAEICCLGESVVLGWNGHPPFKVPVTLWQTAKFVFVAEHEKKTQKEQNQMQREHHVVAAMSLR